MTSSGSPVPLRIGDEQRAEFQNLLMEALRNGLDAGTPGSHLGTASMLLDIASAASDPAARGTVIRALVAWDCPETSAAALAMATLAGDDRLRRQLRRDIADRGHQLPSWLVQLHRTEPVQRAVELSNPYRVVDELLIGVVVPGGHPITAVVRVDNELGFCAVGASVFTEHLQTVLQRIEDDGNPDLTVRDVDPADARARLTDALSKKDLAGLLGDDLPWQRLRPVVTWLLTFLPEGGDPLVPGHQEDVDLDELVAGFLASPWGRPWTRGGLPLLVEEVLGDGLDNGLGDPLLWAPHHVARVLDPESMFLRADELDVDRTPELLRDLIRYGHAERGLRLALTDASLAAVDRYADAFRAAVRSWEAASE
jgi:hypothetical protein